MNRSTLGLVGALALVTAALWAPVPALAEHEVLNYKVVHPRYGDIGTYSNVIDETAGKAEVQTELHIAVKFLGISLFTQDGTRTEQWQDNRLMAFHAVTTTNGKRVEVHGEARGDTFVVNTPLGTFTAPANVRPSNPWSAELLDTTMVMSTTSGELFRAKVSGGAEKSVNFDGTPETVKQYEIDTNRHDFVWFDNRGVPVAFRTERDGTPVDFVLIRPGQQASGHS